ncbi:hypothetical protein GCM10027456_37950 [Kineosporia babensis]
MATMYDQSEQWAHITSTLITPEVAADLSSFRSSSPNFKIALWDPGTNGVRYLKDLVYNLGLQLTDRQRARLRRIRHRQVGDPITVRCHGELLCMDYLQALYELDCLDHVAGLPGGRVLEIGAGYGRTCHALMSNHDLAGYTIIDLPNTLELSRAYLKAVLEPQQYARITFLTNEQALTLPEQMRFDLCININSFGEMPATTVTNYLRLIAQRCEYFYTKNQTGKYMDKRLDGHAQGDEVVAKALSSGLLRDILDIYDSGAVEASSQKYVDAMRPGQEWTCVVDSWARPWSFYWQALYHRDLSAGEPVRMPHP